MPMKFVIDRCSLIKLKSEEYYLDKHKGSLEYNKLKGFFIEKFRRQVIIVIDKVDKEGIRFVKKEFEIKIIISTRNNSKLLKEVAKNPQNRNPKCNNDNTQKEEFRKKADISLIAYCLRLRNNGVKPCLITEETTNEYHNTNFYKKIPNICKNYGIECYDIKTLITEKI